MRIERQKGLGTFRFANILNKKIYIKKLKKRTEKPHANKTQNQTPKLLRVTWLGHTLKSILFLLHTGA